MHHQQNKPCIEENTENNKNILLEDMLVNYDKIAIPAFQRDYAQGRNDNGVEDLRNNFLNVLFDSLINNKKIKLDYIYGYSNKGVFYLIDGQQRITTLWLLYIFIYCTNCKSNDLLNKFAYYTSENATKFTKQISNTNNVTDLFNYINKIKKYEEYKEYMLDQSIYSFINMLEAIKKKYDEKNIDIGIDKLNNITFDIIDVKDQQTGENLYLKMNSRGKPLSAFENFKAWLFENKDIKNSCAQVINNDWIKLFWKLDKSNYDKIIMNFIDICTVYFYFISMCKQDIDGEQKKKCIDKYNELKDNTSTILIKSLYMDDKGNNIINPKAVTVINNLINKLKDMEDGIAILSDTELANKEIKSFQKIFAMLCYIKKNGSKDGDFAEWYNSIWRVIENTRNDINSDDIMSYFTMITNMIQYTTGENNGYNSNIVNIKEELKEIFGYEMIQEEIEKAKLIKEKEDRLEYFQKAHNHCFFKGKIGFLIKICTEKDKFNDELFKKRYEQLSKVFDASQTKAIPQISMLQKYDYYWYSDGTHGKYVNFGKISDNIKERLQWYQKVFNNEKFSQFYFTRKKRTPNTWWESCMITYPEIFKIMESKKLYLYNKRAYIVHKSKFSKNDYHLYTYGFYCYCKNNNIKTLNGYYGKNNSGESVRFSFIYAKKEYDVCDKNGRIQIYYYGKTKKVTTKKQAVCKEFNIDKYYRYSDIIEKLPKKITL